MATELKDDDAAFVLGTECNPEMYFPQGTTEVENIPDNVLWIAAIGTRFADDEDWREELKEWFLNKTNKAN